MSDKWNFPGSKWWKFDCHTHTPESGDFGKGDNSLKSIKPEEWLQKAMQSGLDCVAVTDHNSGGWIDRLKTKNKELDSREPKPDWYRKLTIFPGVEITVADSRNRIHVLAIFDPSCDSQKITGVLGSCRITEGHGDPQYTSTKIGFVETVKMVKDAGGIAIPAHADGVKGLLEGTTSLNPELKESLEAVTAVELCNLHKFDNAEPCLKKKIDFLAKLGGSDAHIPSKIGMRFSWLKMGKPSVESLRHALLDHEFCVKNQSEDPNQPPDIFLSKLVIQNMNHCGHIKEQPFELKLHPHFNSVIGGRGAGKSTALESIRIVLRRDQDLATEAPRVKDELDKFMKPSKDKGVMLRDTEILLTLHRRGKIYQLRWRFDGKGAVLEKADTHEEVEAGNLKERFPVSIFSQKQINELASNPRGLLEIVDRSPEVGRAEWNSRWNSLTSQFLQLRERRRELLRQISGEQQIRGKLSDVENDLKQYEEKGHGRLLKEYQKCRRQKNSLPDDQIFDDLSSSIRELVPATELSDFPEYLFDGQDETTAEMRSIHEQTAQKLKRVSETLGALAKFVDSLKTQRTKDISSSKWHQAVNASSAAYRNLIEEYKEKKSQFTISLYGEWVQQRDRLQRQLGKLNSVRKEAVATEKQTGIVLAKLQELRSELLEKREIFLATVVGSNPLVRMKLVPYGDVGTLEDKYRSLLHLEVGLFTRSVCDQESEQGILWNLFKWEDLKTPESNLAQLILDIKTETFKIANGQARGNHGAFDNRLKELHKSQPVAFDQLDTWWPEDLLRVKYSKDLSSGKFDDLEKGSAGQKAAAILAFLLSYGSGPLVIDQPEDDLDNALIYDLIVKQIHENKNKRQLIIATHNPNIVVNGDSELVHVLKFKKGQVQIDQKGGLEEASIREPICTIMEGGREAFDKRYKRITLED